MSNRRSPWLTLTAILVYGFLYLPIVTLIIFAFNSSRQNVVFEGIVNRDSCGPFYWFCTLANNREAIDATKNTLIIAIASTIVATIIGTMAALALQRHAFRLKLFAETSLYIPIVIPEIVMGISILVLFNAIFNYLNTTFNLSPDQRLGMGIGTVIISHIAFSVPFVALTVRARLQL
jgi:spermidine/putrescine transport system permease protein